MKPKNINALMVYLRKKKNIEIHGSTQKKKLRYMGYFHGYKGYRYCTSPASIIPYSNFNEIQAVYDFDMRLKSLLYPRIMFLETAIKNYTLECTIDICNSERFADVFSTALTYYKVHAVGSTKYKEAMTQRLKLREHVYSTISRDYKRSLVSHYYDKDEPVPIWSIFELLSLGELGTYIACANILLKKNLSKSIGFKTSVDSDGKLPEMFVYALRDLRNAVAHNGTVFDTRFKTANINNRISTYIERETGISNIKFSSIIDYVILIIFLMKCMECNRTDMLGLICEFEKACEKMRASIPANMFMQIIYSDNKNKLKLLKQYCKQN